MSILSANPRVLRLAGALLVVFLGIWTGMRVYSHYGRAGFAARSARTATLQVPVGKASPPSPSDTANAIESLDPAPAPAKIPERLPEFSLTDQTGKRTSIATWSGKSLILNFWATWCAPCRHEIPLLASLNGVWSSQDVQVVGIAVDHRDAVKAYAEEFKIPYPLLIGEQDALDVAAALGFDSPVFPFTVFTDRRGEIVALYVGELHKPQTDLILSVVQSLNRGRLQLPQARRSIADGLHALSSSRPG